MQPSIYCDIKEDGSPGPLSGKGLPSCKECEQQMACCCLHPRLSHPGARPSRAACLLGLSQVEGLFQGSSPGCRSCITTRLLSLPFPFITIVLIEWASPCCPHWLLLENMTLDMSFSLAFLLASSYQKLGKHWQVSKSWIVLLSALLRSRLHFI